MYWSFRLRGDARGRNGGVRQALAEGMRRTGRTACARSVLFCSVSQQWLCCSPTLTPSAAGRARKGARRRRPAEAGARPMEGRASATTAAMPRNNSVWPRCGGSVAFADPIRFRARRTGRDIPGRQVRRARAARGYAETREAAMAAFAKSWRREGA